MILQTYSFVFYYSLFNSHLITHSIYSFEYGRPCTLHFTLGIFPSFEPEMDAISLLIGILTAESDVERKMLGKHAYTIVFEARQKGLFQKVSKEMGAFPESLLPKQENDELWSIIKKDLRSMSDIGVEHTIRNHIDAHKSSSFECQYETFRSCNWGQAVYDLLALLQISDRLLGVIESVFSKYKDEIESVTNRIKTRVSMLDDILEKLKQE